MNNTLILLAIVLTIVLATVYSLILYQPQEKKSSIPSKTYSLITNKTYIRNRVNSFLNDNPKANESYAEDVVYHDIAISEKNSTICSLINTKWLKEDCYNYFKVS